jgi:hypothetical protein
MKTPNSPALTLDRCPTCSTSFDVAENRYQGPPPTTLNPFKFHLERGRRVFMVRCPKCKATFVSKKLKLFGFVTYGWYWSIPLFLLLAGFTLASFMQR